MIYPKVAVHSQYSAFRTRRAWIVHQKFVLVGLPFYTLLMPSQDTIIHHNGYHQPGDVIHIVAAIWSPCAVVVRLGKAETSLGDESFSLGLLVLVCSTMSTILLPTTMGLGAQAELLGSTIAFRMASLVQFTFLASCSLKDMFASS